MQARQPSLRRCVVWHKGQNPSYMTKMVTVSLGFVLPLTVEFLAGIRIIEWSGVHKLMPSLEVSQIVMYESTQHMQ